MARKWWTLITVSIATFMLLLDVTIVNVALPEIERDLGASLTDLQWVVDSYVLALTAQEFTPRERKTALGIWGASVGVGVAVGPLVGGVLVDSLGWEWIFFVNVPVGLLTIALALTKLGEARDPTPGRLDWAGLRTFSSALFLLIFGVLRGNGEGWSSPEIVGSLAGGAALLAAFVAIELRSRNPMLDL